MRLILTAQRKEHNLGGINLKNASFLKGVKISSIKREDLIQRLLKRKSNSIAGS